MQPKSPSPDFDFMLKDSKPAKRSLPIPNLSKPILIALAAIGAIILIIIISSVISGRNKGDSQPFAGVLARGRETLRVTTLVKQQLSLRDPQTQALAATVNSALSSDVRQISSYMAKNHLKASAVQLAADTDKTTDASLQTAAQNNNLDAAYVNYIKNALTRYQSDLQAALNGAGPNGKKLLTGSIESTRAIMNSSPIKNS